VTIRVKICGIVHPDDAELAIEAGADLIGLNFVPDSPRCIDLETAAAIAERAAGRVERVGVFRNAEPDEIERVLRRVDLDRLQFHGEETEDREAAETYPGTIVLLDHPDGNAGSGKAWDWSASAELIESGHDVILAGGLSPQNVAQVLADLGDAPWGVDVATGVEGSAYRKDAAKLREFVAAVRGSETTVSEAE